METGLDTWEGNIAAEVIGDQFDKSSGDTLAIFMGELGTSASADVSLLVEWNCILGVFGFSFSFVSGLIFA